MICATILSHILSVKSPNSGCQLQDKNSLSGMNDTLKSVMGDSDASVEIRFESQTTSKMWFKSDLGLQPEQSSLRAHSFLHL